MASATANVVVTETVTGVHLDLSIEEARTLLTVSAHIGGNPVKSPRRHMESISQALRVVLGARFDSIPEYQLLNPYAQSANSILFLDYEVDKTE